MTLTTNRNGAFVLARLVLAAAIAMTAAGGVAAEGASQSNLLRFGSLPAISAVPVIFAAETGLFEEEGVAVEIIPFNSPTERNVALQTGRIDAFVGDVMTAIAFRQGGFPVVVTSDIAEDFKLLTAPGSGIDTFSLLDGRTVSLVPNFVLEYIMDEMAEANGIGYEVIVIPSISARFEALLSGQVDAVLFTEPQASLLAGAGAGVLAGSLEYGIKAGAMIFREEYLIVHRGLVQAFYRAYNRAVEELNGTNLTDLREVLSAYGFPPDVSARVGGVLNLPRAEALPDQTIADVITWMERDGATVEVSPADLVDYSALQ